MKRFFSLLACAGLLGSLILTGCGPHTEDSASPAPPSGPETAEEMLSIYEEAAAVYDWFDLCSLPVNGEDTKVVDGETYWRVDSNTISTYADLESAVRTYFSPAISDALLQSSINYRDIDGALYTLDGARGSHIDLFDKTVRAEHPDESHWTVELLFWTDLTDEAGRHTFGYSSEVLNYEQIDEGFRFTNFCSSDALDLEADTVCTFDPREMPAPDEDAWPLICRLMYSDGAPAEAASGLLLQRFLEAPELTVLALSRLADSPFHGLAGYEQVGDLLISPALTAASLPEAERAAFEAALAACDPEGEAAEVQLNTLKDAYQTAISEK